MRRLLLLLLNLPFAMLNASAETYTAAGFALDAPAGWTRGESTAAPLVLYAPNPMKDFRPNINVLVQETGKLNNQQYFEMSKQQAAKMNGKISGYSDFQFDNKLVGKSLRLDFTTGGRDLSCLSVWCQRNGKTYLITSTTSPEDYAARLSSFQQVSRTFRFTGR